MSKLSPEFSPVQYQEVFQQLHPLAYKVLFGMSAEEMRLNGLSPDSFEPLKAAVIYNKFPAMIIHEGESYILMNLDEIAEFAENFHPLHPLLF